jgi:hypothetical protein
MTPFIASFDILCFGHSGIELRNSVWKEMNFFAYWCVFIPLSIFRVHWKSISWCYLNRNDNH